MKQAYLLGWVPASLLIFAISGCGEGYTIPMAKPVIVDTDMDFDDTAAISYLCREHKLGHLALKAVTVTNSGAAYPGQGIKHARCLLEQCGLPDVMVADGSPTAVNEFPKDLRDSVDKTLSSVFASCSQSAMSSPLNAAELLSQIISMSPEKVTLVVTGPVSNVATALKENPRLKNNIDHVYMMGGAVAVPGNLCCGAPTSFDNSQEFNVWVDPPAASFVLSALEANTVSLVPLNATNSVPMTAEFATKLQAQARTQEAKIVAAITKDGEVTPGIAGGFLYWWDPLAAVAVLHPEVVTYEPMRVTVVQSGANAGQTKKDDGGPAVRVGTKADKTRFEAIFLDTLDSTSTEGH